MPTVSKPVDPQTADFAVGSAFDLILKETLVWEGGLDDDPQDPGGRTAYGIIQREYDKWNRDHGLPPLDVWKISRGEVKLIYYFNYWKPLQCGDYSPPVAAVVFDYGVNSGNHQAIKDSQRCLGVVADGMLGPQTHAALVATTPPLFAHRLDARRLALLENLPTWGRFGRGWETRVDGETKFADGLITTI